MRRLLSVIVTSFVTLSPFAADREPCPVPAALHNDNYCDDLVNGCDEPKTSACSMVKRVSTFACNASVTGEPHLLPASQVGDTICDCCDGSDEAPGTCPNTCESLQEEYLNDAFQWYEDVTVGKERRDAAMAEARAILGGWQVEMNKIEASVSAHRSLLTKLRKLRAIEERKEGWENFWWLREKRRRSVGRTGQSLDQGERDGEEEESVAAPEMPESETEPSVEGGEDSNDMDAELADEDEDLEGVPSEGAGVLNRVRVSLPALEAEEDPLLHAMRATIATDGRRSLSLQAYLDSDMAASATAQAASTLKTALAAWEPAEVLELNLQALGALVLGPFYMISWALRLCQNELWEALGKLTSGDKKRHVQQGFDRGLEGKVETFETALSTGLKGKLEWALDAITQGPVLALALARPETIADAPERLEAALLRFAVNQLEGQCEEEVGRVEELRERMEYPGYSAEEGDEKVYVTWRDTCFEKSEKTFDYKVCPFHEVKQDHVLVGKWAGWIKRENGQGVAEGAGPVMFFSEGQQCWNGPKRSAVVQLWCGLEEQLVEVSEPTVCVYDFVLMTPLACTEAALAQAEERLRNLGIKLPEDELSGENVDRIKHDEF